MREGPAARGARERERLQRHVFARARDRGNCVIPPPPPHALAARSPSARCCVRVPPRGSRCGSLSPVAPGRLGQHGCVCGRGAAVRTSAVECGAAVLGPAMRLCSKRGRRARRQRRWPRPRGAGLLDSARGGRGSDAGGAVMVAQGAASQCPRLSWQACLMVPRGIGSPPQTNCCEFLVSAPHAPSAPRCAHVYVPEHFADSNMRGGPVFASGAGSEADDLQSRLASSNGALQSLLRRLSTGMEDLLPNAHGRARMKVSQ